MWRRPVYCGVFFWVVLARSVFRNLTEKCRSRVWVKLLVGFWNAFQKNLIGFESLPPKKKQPKEGFKLHFLIHVLGPETESI